MKIKMILAKLGNPVVGTLEKSQKAKIDEMEGWGDYPFEEYKVKSVKSDFVFEKKHKAVTCVSCGRRAHAK